MRVHPLGAMTLVTTDSLEQKRQEAYQRKGRNVAVWEDTQKRCEEEPELKRPRYLHIRICPGGVPASPAQERTWDGKVVVAEADCVDLAAELSRDADNSVVLLNMASASNPGGSVKSGCNTQEEHLCRCSNLQVQLQTQMHNYPLRVVLPKSDEADFKIIVLSEVLIFKDPKDYRELPREKWSKVGVVTAAAENVKHTDRTLGKFAQKDIYHLLKTASELKPPCTHLVLSAWGCGAFGQNPLEVARCFKAALESLEAGQISSVYFGILDDHNSQPPGNLRAFRDVFKQ